MRFATRSALERGIAERAFGRLSTLELQFPEEGWNA